MNDNIQQLFKELIFCGYDKAIELLIKGLTGVIKGSEKLDESDRNTYISGYESALKMLRDEQARKIVEDSLAKIIKEKG